MREPMALLRQCGIKPTPQRIAVVVNVLKSKTHPSADDVLDRARRSCPTISRATVYNTLNLLVGKGLLCAQILKEGTVVFDPMTERHHHFIDDETGEIYDIPWDTLTVTGKEKLKDFVVREYQVIIRGRRKSTK